jgi:L,D-peptidoglycan transpeptidase YkuD (ErfK/YbiS/YcfS/YnhG family)
MSALKYILAIMLLLCVGEGLAAAPREDVPGEWHAFLSGLETTLGGSSQCLLVVNDDASSPSARVYALERKHGRWKSVRSPMRAMIGKNGFAPPGGKREGDGRTPSGVFPMGTAFGYDPSVQTRMPYRQATAEDVWVDDPGADDYNRWAKKGQTKAGSFEIMQREDHLYRYGIVIEYNTNPVVKGQGSAIFFHVWLNSSESTHGCVALSERHMRWILRWLDPAARPVAVMGTVRR